MIFGRTKLELKVGIFVFIGLVILGVFVLLIGDIRSFTAGYKINISFEFVNGVKVGAPVRFAGVDVGEVKETRFVFIPQQTKTKVIVVAWIRNEVKIPSDSTVWVNTLGLLGEKYIEIIPGKNYENCLKPGESLIGNDPIAMHEVSRLAKNIAEDIDESIVKLKNKEGTIGKLLYDDSIYKELELMTKQIQNLIKEAEELVRDVRKHPWKLFWKTKERPERK